MLIVLLLATLSIVFINTWRVYNDLPFKERKKRAQRGNTRDKAIYEVTAHGSGVSGILWLFIILSAGGATTIFGSLGLDGLTKFSATTLYFWVVFVWLPTRAPGKISSYVVFKLTPYFLKFYKLVHPAADLATKLNKKYLQKSSTRPSFYDKDDLRDLLKSGEDNAGISLNSDLALLLSVLDFGSKTVRDFMTPRRAIKMVALNDSIGPVLMDELHNSGHSRFPVYKSKQDDIVGILFLRDLIDSPKSATIEQIYQPNVCFVHEEELLQNALQAIIKTHQQLFVVVNNFEEFVGVISIEDVFEQLIGQDIVDEFDQYEDIRAVATRQAAKEHKKHKPKNDDTS